MYEVAAVQRALAVGETELPEFTLSETLTAARVLEAVRAQLGAVLPAHGKL